MLKNILSFIGSRNFVSFLTLSLIPVFHLSAQDCGVAVSQTIPSKTPCLGSYKVNTSDSKGAGFNASQYESWAYWDVHAHDYNNATFCLPFRMLKPLNYNNSGSKLYPLIVMLHGAGECGLDNNRVLYNGGQAHLTAVNNGSFDGFVVFPQAPVGNWAAANPEDTTSSTQMTDQLARMFAMVDSLKLRFKIDPDRVVIHGLSAGGTGTLASLYHRPDLFAAALPMSATTSTSNYNTGTTYPNPPWTDPSVEPKVRRNMGFISPIPLWWFQGGIDVNPSKAITTPSVQFLRDSGATNTTKTNYTIYPTVGHETWYNAYAEPNFFPFINAQNKKHVYVMGNTTICCGQTTMLAFSPGFYDYQWFKDGVAIPGQTRNRLKGITQGGQYFVRCIRRGSSAYYYSETVTITNTDPVNTPPSVSFTSPANNASFTSPATISLTATASDADGTVSKVEFYNGSALLSSDASSPYTYSWTGVAAGTYTLTAKATDNLGAVTTSSTVNVTVAAPTNQSPTVSLTSPVNNAIFSAPATISIAATASDVDGTVASVDFYNGSTLLFSDATAPYSYSWSGAAAGTYVLTAKATDDLGAVTTSTSVTVVVTATNKYPVVSLTSPTNNAGFISPATITLTASASDPDGSITKVNFYNGTTLLYSDASAPFTYDWAGVTPGTYTLLAKAVDNQNAVQVSTSVQVTVTTSNTPPVVSLTTPVNNAAYSAPASVLLTASASDADGSVAKVEFYNGSTLIGTVTSSPFSYTWTGVATGTYTLSAKATDNVGASTSSSGVKITVTSTNKYPVVSLTSPSNNASFLSPATITISANASDADGSIMKVNFYSGSTLLYSDVTAPYSYDWAGATPGTYTILAKAVDNQSAVQVSTSVQVVVSTSNAREDDALEEEPASVMTGNGSGADQKLRFTKDVAALQIVSSNGTVVYAQSNLVSGSVLELGHLLSQGLNIVQIHYTDGTAETRKIPFLH